MILPFGDDAIVRGSFKPFVILQVPRMQTLPEINGEHGLQKGAQRDRVSFRIEILLDHDAFQRPRFQRLDVTKGTYQGDLGMNTD